MPGRIYASNTYRYGFNGKEKDDEIKGNANGLDFGERFYDSRLARWFKLDKKEMMYAGWSPYHFGYDSPIMTIDPNGEENVVIVGSDNGNRRGSNGQYNDAQAGLQMRNHFLLTGAKVYNQYAQASTTTQESTTMLLYSTGNVKEDQRLKNLAIKNGVNASDIVIVKNRDDIAKYMNSRRTRITVELSDRPIPLPTMVTQQDKITDLTFVGHGTATTLYFDNPYVSPGQQEQLRSSDLGYYDHGITPQDFTSNACINTISCRGETNFKSSASTNFLISTESYLRSQLQDGNVTLKGIAPGQECYWWSESECIFNGGSETIKGGKSSLNEDDKDGSNISISEDNCWK